MANMNRIMPLVIVTGVGIYNGLYVFEPAFKEQKEQKDKTFEKQHGTQESDSSQDSRVQEPAANTTKSASGENAAQAALQKNGIPNAASGSGSSWFKGWGLPAWPGSKASNEAKQPADNAPRTLEQPPSPNKSEEKSP